MENWMVSHHTFAVRTYFETESIVHMEMHFHCEFHVLRHGRIPSHNAILKLVNDFNACGSAVHMLAGSAHSVHTPENAE
jgi:glucokinase